MTDKQIINEKMENLNNLATQQLKRVEYIAKTHLVETFDMQREIEKLKKELQAKEKEYQQLINKNNRLEEELNATKLLLEGKNNQYAAKMQECETLASQLDFEAQKKECLEQECEELKEEIKHYKQIAQFHGNLSVKYTNKSAKLKQTLTKIKPILELYANSKIGEKQEDGTYKIIVEDSKALGSTYITFDPKPAKQALQKISEVENE